VILSNKFFEVNKFVSGTNHVYAANIILVSKRFWDRLSPAEQRSAWGASWASVALASCRMAHAAGR